jgi:hypothetical protein
MTEATGLMISHSELKTFALCRRRWWLSYFCFQQLKDDSPVGVVHIGSAIHLALEGYHGYNLDPLAVVQWSYADIISKRPEYERELLKDQDMALAIVEGYVTWAAENGFYDGLEVLATEHELKVPVTLADGTTVTFRAKLDQLVRRVSDGRRQTVDFKSVGTLAKANTLTLDTQMRFYTLLLALAEADPVKRADGALYVMLKRSKRTERAKGPFYEVASISYNKTDLNNTWLRSRAIASEIITARQRLNAGEDHHAVVWENPTDFCSWGCQYLKICPLFNDGSRTEDMLAAEYETRLPYLYYEGDRIQQAVIALNGTSQPVPVEG